MTYRRGAIATSGVTDSGGTAATRIADTAVVWSGRLVIAIALVGLAISAYGWWSLEGSFSYSQWSDRDLLRSANLLNDFPVAGAELSYGVGGRIPGGLLHYLWFPILLINDSPIFVERVQLALHLAAAVVLFFTLRRYYGYLAGIVAGGLYLVSPIGERVVSQLWNPGFEPFFAAVALFLIVKALQENRADLFPWAAASIFAAAQMHLSALLLLIPIFASVAIISSARSWRPWLGILIALVALFSPYLIVEVWTGFPNLKLLLSQVDQSVRPRQSILSENVIYFFRRFIDPWDPDASWPRGARLIAVLAAATLYVFTALAILFAIARGPIRRLSGSGAPWLNRDVVMIGLVILIVGCWIYFSSNRDVDLKLGHSARYLIVPLMAANLLAGIMVGKLVQAIRAAGWRWTEAIAALVLAGVLLSANLVTAEEHARWGRARVGYTWFDDLFTKVAAATGWRYEDVPLKLSVWRDARGVRGWYWDASDPVHYELFRRGLRTYSGSANSPCGAFLNYYPQPLNASEAESFLRSRFAQDLGYFRVQAVHEIGTGKLVVYSRLEGRCITSFSNRYVLSPEEEATQAVYFSMKPGEVRSVSGKPNDYLIALNSERCNGCREKILFYLRLIPKPGVMDIELHSNQLRGQGHNTEFFDLGMIGRPILHLTKEGVTQQIRLAHDLVGHKGELTPIILRDVPVLAGRYRAALAMDVIGDNDQVRWPVAALRRVPRTIEIPTDLVVPSGSDQNPLAQLYRQLREQFDANYPGRGVVDYPGNKIADVPKGYAMILKAEILALRAGLQTTSTLAETAARWLLSHSDERRDGFPGWGLPVAWDAYGDGTENPPHTKYAISTAIVIDALLDWLEFSPSHAGEVIPLLRSAIKPYLQPEILSPAGLLPFSLEASDRRYDTFNPAAYLAGVIQRFTKFETDAQSVAQMRATADRTMALLRKERKLSPTGSWYWHYSIGEDVPNDLGHAAYIVHGIQLYVQNGGRLGSQFDVPAIERHLMDFVRNGAGLLQWPVFRDDVQDPPRSYDLGMGMYLACGQAQLEAVAKRLINWIPAYRTPSSAYTKYPYNWKVAPLVVREYEAYMLLGIVTCATRT